MCESLRLVATSQHLVPRGPLDLSNSVTSSQITIVRAVQTFHQFLQCHSDPGGQGEKPQWGSACPGLCKASRTLLTDSAIQSYILLSPSRSPHVTRLRPFQPLTTWRRHEKRGDSPVHCPLLHWAKPDGRSYSSPSRAACAGPFWPRREGMSGPPVSATQTLLVIAPLRCLQNPLAPCPLQQQRRKARLSTATGLVC